MRMSLQSAVPVSPLNGHAALPSPVRLLQRRRTLCLLLTLLQWFHSTAVASPGLSLEEGFANPPNTARLRAYWWWLNGNVTKQAITRDLEGMKATGWGGALICDADGASQDGNDRVPHGPTFFTPAWRELYKHALREANRLGLEMSLNIQSGWNLGGPMVTADDAAKKLVWSEVVVSGPTNLSAQLPAPKLRDDYQRSIAVLAYRLREDLPANRPPVRNWQEKAIHKALSFSAPDTTLLHQDVPGQPNEQDARTGDVIDLSGKLASDGTLRWLVPAGRWQVLHFAYTIGDHSSVSTSSDGWKGYALDVLDRAALGRYWDAVVEPLIRDAGPLAGKTLKYLHTDSWEVEPLNWTPKLRERFLKYRGYEMLPWMPVLAGRIINTREESNRFLNDFRKTLGDLAVDEHFLPFLERAHKHGLQIHPESGGPHAVPIDAQRCLGQNDMPMSEFWAWSWRHRVGDQNRFFVKQPASAAHTYGHRLVAAEGFTTIGPHWQETIWDNLKPAFDKALCEGLNLLFWHAFVCSPDEMGMPGQQYFAGTHFNPNTTWWASSGPFINYINRCQFMLQQGRFVADACYYYGDHVPNFAQLKSSDPARISPGYDYDVITEEALLTRAAVRDGRIVLPDGMSYRVLVLPDRTMISQPVLVKLSELVKAGATVAGPKPRLSSTLKNYPKSDAAVAKLGERMWGDCDGTSVKEHAFGRGRVVWGWTTRELLLMDGVKPDFEFKGAGAGAMIDYIHRRDQTTDVYFVANRSNRVERLDCSFRVSGKSPELWDTVTGERRYATAYAERDGRTTVPLEFSPCGSWFVVFREASKTHPATTTSNSRTFSTLAEVEASWTVRFDPKWGGPASAQFDRLVSWSDRAEPGIKYYSGTATYTRGFDLPTEQPKVSERLWLDLGNLRELAAIRVNGRNLGVVWTPPFRVDITDVVKPSGNVLEVDIVNFWPNRIVGDATLPVDKRFTQTNIRKLAAETPLMTSGLLGPVRILVSRP